MLDTNEVGEPAHSASRAEKVTELRRTVDGGRVKDDVRVDVLPVHMGTDYVCVLALEEALGQLAPHEVCRLRRNLAGLKRLTYVVGNDARSLASCALCILPFRECELSRDELRCAAIGIDQ